MSRNLQPRTQRTERLEARLTAAQKELLEQAAALREENVSSFVIRCALKVARRRLLEEESIKVSDRDRRALVNALVAPPNANASLRKAFALYKKEHAA